MDISSIGYSLEFAALGIPLSIFSGIVFHLLENYDRATDNTEKNKIKKYLTGSLILVIILVVGMVYIGNAAVEFGRPVEQSTQLNPSCANQSVTYVVNYYNISEVIIENKKSTFSVEELKYLIQNNPRKP